MNVELCAHPFLRASVEKLMFGNQGLSEEIIPQSFWTSFFVLGVSISVTAKILLSGGSKKMTEFSLIFSAEIIVPPNLTAVLSENFDGASFRLILLHNFANFSICISRSFSVFPNTQKSSIFLRTWKSSSSLRLWSSWRGPGRSRYLGREQRNGKSHTASL